MIDKAETDEAHENEPRGNHLMTSTQEMTDHALFMGKVWHRRLRPVEHRFSYPFWWAWINLDDVEGLLRRSVWWGRAWRPIVFNEQDYLDRASGSLRERIAGKADSLGLDWRVGTVCLMSQPRIFGWLFNPISLYWHFLPGRQRPDAVIAEVHNTPWNEKHWYRLDLAEVESGANMDAGLRLDRISQKKAFHVSPFMPMDLRYEWRLGVDMSAADVAIDNHDDEGVLFSAGVSLQRVNADKVAMTRVLTRYGAQAFKVSLAIYAHAWRIWRKGVGFHRHPIGNSTREH